MAIATFEKQNNGKGSGIEGYDLALLLFLGILVGLKMIMIERIILPIWDGAAYLVNARNLLSGAPLYEWFRPPVLPIITAGIWLFTGENFVIIKYIQLIFILLTGVVFYVLLKKDMGGLFALAGTILLMTSTQVLLWSDHILVHGISLFFATLTVLLWRKYTAKRWLLGGLSGSLALLSRYPTGIVIIAVLFAYTIDHRKLILLYGALVGLLLPIVPLYFYSPSYLVELAYTLLGVHAGFGLYTDGGAVTGTYLFYLLNSWNVFKVCSILVLPVLFLKSTYKQIKNRVWLYWLGSSFIFYSLMPNKQLRFTFEWMPAIVYLSMLTIFKAKSAFKNTKLKKRMVWGIAVAVLLGFNTVYSINDYLVTFDNYSGFKDRSILEVADYIKVHSSREEIIISDAHAALLTLYSDRTVYDSKAETLAGLRVFLEEGYGTGWDTTLLVIFPNLRERGTFTIDELSNQPYLTLEKTYQLSGVLGNAYIFDITL